MQGIKVENTINTGQVIAICITVFTAISAANTPIKTIFLSNGVFVFVVLSLLFVLFSGIRSKLYSYVGNKLIRGALCFFLALFLIEVAIYRLLKYFAFFALDYSKLEWINALTITLSLVMGFFWFKYWKNNLWTEALDS